MSNPVRLFYGRALEILRQAKVLVVDVNPHRRRTAQVQANDLLKEMDRCRRRMLELSLPPTEARIQRDEWEWDFKYALESIQKECERLVDEALALSPWKDSDAFPDNSPPPEVVAAFNHAVQVLNEGESRLNKALDGLWRLEQGIDWTASRSSSPPQAMLLEQAANAPALEKKSTKPRDRPLSCEEANAKAIELAGKDHSFVYLSQRGWAKAIGCGLGTVSKLPFWNKIMEETDRGRKDKARVPRVVSLTSTREASIGKLGSDEDSDKDELTRLIADQERERKADPSPLDDDPPGTRPRKSYCRKQV